MCRNKYFLFAALLILVVACSKQENDMLIRSDFPGGNILVDSVVGNTIYVRRDQKGTDTAKGEWFYWQFQVKNAQGKDLQFVFNQDHAITRNGPAYSKDKGKTWHFLYPDTLVDTNAFSFRFNKHDTSVLFCMTIPYVKSDWERFLASNSEVFDHYMKTSILTETRQGRMVHYYKLKNPDQEIKRTLFFTARHHACESTASFVLEGVIDAFLHKLHRGDPLAQGTQLIAFPFMDQDGVQLGEQGKNRYPHDHNRDYIQFLYKTTYAVDSLFAQLTEGTPTMNIDLHSPWIKYNQNETLFFIGQEKADFEDKLKTLVAILDTTHQGELPFSSETAIFPFGKNWNIRTLNESFNSGLLSFSQWGALQENVVLATTLEVPYSNVHGVPVTKANLRDFGQSLLEGLLLLE